MALEVEGLVIRSLLRSIDYMLEHPERVPGPGGDYWYTAIEHVASDTTFVLTSCKRCQMERFFVMPTSEAKERTSYPCPCDTSH